VTSEDPPPDDPDDRRRLNSVWAAVDALQRTLREINVQPALDAQRTLREMNLQPALNAQRTLREMNLQPALDAQRTLRAINLQPNIQRTLREINAQPMVNMQRTLREINAQPWESIRASLAAFQEFAAADAVASASDLMAEAEAAEVQAGVGSEAPGCLAGLPITAQLSLLVAALKVLDEFGKFLADASNAEVPAEVRSATQTLFAVVCLLLMFIELRSRPPDGS
jgi:uncharacterized protein YqgV (UPF0045/DUF77 family)